MENTIEINEINEVDPTHGSSVAASSECTPVEPVVVEFESESESGAGAGDESVSVSGAGAGGEGGSAAFQKKER
jgi:hypothetical protein